MKNVILQPSLRRGVGAGDSGVILVPVAMTIATTTAIGAGVGAAIGLTSNNVKRDAIRGAIAGAVVGAGAVAWTFISGWSRIATAAGTG